MGSVCTHGNAALHCVALHDRPDIYLQALELVQRPSRAMVGANRPRPSLPRTVRSRRSMRQWRPSRRLWVCGSVSCVRTPLEEIDTLFKHVGGREFHCCAGCCLSALPTRLAGESSSAVSSDYKGKRRPWQLRPYDRFEISQIRRERGDLLRGALARAAA